MARHWDLTNQPTSRRETPTQMEIAAAPTRETINARALIDLWPAYLEGIHGRTTRQTRTNYTNQIGPACRFWRDYGPAHHWQIAPETGPALIHYLRTETGLGQNSIRTTVRRVRQFFKWIHTSGRLPIDISGWADLPAAHQTTIRTLSQEDLARVLAACTGANRIRDLALICFLVETGARRAEAAALDYKNVAWTAAMDGSAYLEVVKGYKDADKRRTVQFGRRTGKLLQIMRVVYGRDLLAGSVFGLTGSGISHAIGGVSKRAGVEVAPHDFRRTFATYWIRHCRAPSPALAERLLEVQLGHSPKTVAQAHYMALTHQDVAEHYVSPLDGLELWGL